MAEEISVNELLQCLVQCSQKAARIAQIFREEDELFQLLIEEKSPVEKNKRLVQDFKTLADVLVQETIKRDVGQLFPSLLGNIQGEEQNTFQNSLGESIKVELTASSDDTEALLRKVLDGRDHVAKCLSNVVHSVETACGTQDPSFSKLPANSIGIWIDPIDATAEYIRATNVESVEHAIQPCGLHCVCVLIGAYDIDTGRPLLGVINQPFYCRESDCSKWESKIYWAVSHSPSRCISSTLQTEDEPAEKTVVLSCFENKHLQNTIAAKYRIAHAAGAGYKCLTVASKKADFYVHSQGTTFWWDTCGPHALLASMGGGFIRFDKVLSSTEDLRACDLNERQIKYVSAGQTAGNEAFRNAGGIIAYRNEDDVIEFCRFLRENSHLFQK